MLIPLMKPSLVTLRAHFLLEKLQDATKRQHTFTRIVALGKTGSGISTLGNCLLGADYFLTSDDHHDRYQTINIIQLLERLEYITLPAFSHDGHDENHQRAALGMPQVAHWPEVHELTLSLYDHHRNRKEPQRVALHTTETSLQPDLIFYLLVPHQKLLHYEQAFIEDLLKCYPSEQILYIFNFFASTDTHTPATTLQAIEDARTQINLAYQQAGHHGEADTSIIAVNCWSGQGMADLLAHLQSTLSANNNTLIVELIQYQQQKTPAAYIKALKQELIRFFAEVTSEKSSADMLSPLIEYLHSLTDFLSSLHGEALLVPDKLQSALITLINQITQDCTQIITEVTYISRPQRVYERFPVYRDIEEFDYNRPIYKEETTSIKESYWDDTENPIEFIQSIFDGTIGRKKKWRTRVEKNCLLIGYEKRTRRIIDGYHSAYSHTTYTHEPTDPRVVTTSYHPVGYYGVALLAAFCNIIVTPQTHPAEPSSLEHLYKHIVAGLQEPLAQCQILSATRVSQILQKQMSVLFRSSFDQDIKDFLNLW
jgi:hypothetical protein